MPSISLRLESDGAFEDWLERKPLHHLGNGAPPLRITVLEGGMASGKPSVAIGIDLGEAGVVIAETSLVLLLSAADALRARFGDPRREGSS